MINLKKIVAVAMATTMVMGLSLTASAMDIASPFYGPAQADQNNGNPSGALTGDPVATDEVGKNVTNKIQFDQIVDSSEAAESLETMKQVSNVLAENDASIPDGASVVPIYAANLVDVPKDGVTLTFALSNFDDTGDNYTQYREGDTLYALLETKAGSGVWELAEGTVNGNGEVEFDVNHDGAFVLFKTIDPDTGKMLKLTYKNGSLDPDNPPVIVDPDQPDQPVVPTPDEPGTSTDPSNGQNSNNANGAANANGGSWTTSPKTGEF